MSVEIDQRVVELLFNNKNFEKNVSTSMATLKKFKEDLKFDGATQGMEDLNKAAKSFSLQPLVDAAVHVEDKFSMMSIAAISAINRIVSRATDAGISLVKSLSVDNIAAGWAKFGEKTTSVGTLVSQGYNMDVVEAQLRRLNWFTDETSYNFTDMVNNIAKFTATGKGLEESVTALEGIANWAALSGQNASTASRAMYQLSQAMSAGVMRKEDWKSIQNVSMDTDEFRQKALDAGVALKTLKKNADGTYQSIAVKNAKKFTKSQFSEHLTQDAWFTSDVMMEVFQDYSKAVDEIYAYASSRGITASQAIEELGDSVDAFGLKAFKAAQEARTWGDVVDSVKDAVSTGWMNTFELIFGSYDEAKELFTDLANGLYDVFAEGGNRRNDVLSEGLLSGWKQFLKEGVPDAIEFKDKILQIAEATGNFSDEQLANMRDDFEGSLKDGWLTDGILDDALWELTQDVRMLSDEQLKQKGYSNLQIKALRDLNDAYQEGSIDVKAYADLMAQTSGRENLVQAFWNIYDALFAIDEESGKAMGIISAFKEAIAEIFPPATGDRVYALTERIRDFTERLKPSEETLEKLKSIFKGAASVVDIFKQAFSALYRTLKPVFDLIKTGLGYIFDLTANVGDSITNFASAARESDLFYNSLQKVVDAVKTAVEWFKNAIKPVKEFATTIGSFIGNILHGAGGIFSGMSSSMEKATGVFGVFKQAAEKVAEVIQNVHQRISEGFGHVSIEVTKPLGILKSLWNIASMVLSGLVSLVGEVLGLVQNLFGTFNGVGFKDVFNVLLGVFTAVNIGKMTEGINGITESISGFFESFTGGVKADTMMTTAKAIGILTLALIGLALIDSERLIASAGAIGVLCTYLSGMFKTLSSMVANATTFKGIISSFAQTLQMGKLASTFKTLAISLAIAAAALFLLGKLDWDEIARGLLGMTGVMVIMLASITYLSKLKNADKARGVITKMIPLALAMILFSAAMRNMAKMTWDEMGRSLLGFAGIMLIVIITVAAIQKTKGLANKSVKILKQMIPLALAMILFSAAMRNMAKMTWDDIARSLTAFAGIMLVVVLAVAAIQKVKGLGNKAVKILKQMIPLALAMVLFSAAMRNMANLTWDQIGSSLVGFAGIMAIVVLTVTAIQMVNGTDQAIKIINKMIPLALAMILFSAAMRNMANLSFDDVITSLVGFAGIMLIISLTVAAIQSMSDVDSAVKVLNKMIPLALAMVLISAAMRNMANLSWGEIISSVVAFGLVMAEIVIALKVLTSGEISGGKVAGAAAAILLVSVSMVALAAALKIVASIPIMGLVAAVLALSVALAAIVAAAAFASAVVPGLLALGAACLMIGVGALAAGGGIALLSVGIATLVAIGPAALQMIVDLIQTLAVMAPTVGMALAAALGGFAESLINLGPTLLQLVEMLIDMLLQVVMKDIPKIIAIVGALFDRVIDLLVTLIPKLIQLLGTLLEQLLAAVVDWIPKIVKAGVDIVVGILNGIRDALPRIIVAGVEIILALLEGIGEAELLFIRKAFDLAINFINGLAETIKEKQPLLTEAIINLIRVIIDSFKNSREQWKQLGKDILGGLINGIKEKVSALVETVKEVGGNIVSAFKNFFGIASPSKLMRDEVGRYIVQGIAEGIKSDMSAEEAAKKKAENIVNAFKDSIAKIETEIKAVQLEFGLWNATNTHVKKKDLITKQIEALAKQMKISEKKLADEEAKFKATALSFSEDSVEYQNAANTLLEARTEFANMRNTYFEALANAEEPELIANDAGALVLKGITHEITTNMSAEEAAAKKAENIVAAFDKVFEKIEMRASTMDLQNNIWEIANADAKKEDKMIHDILKNRADQEAQAQRTAYAQARYDEMVRRYGVDSKEAGAAYQDLLKEQEALYRLAAEYLQLEKTGVGFDRAMEKVNNMSEEEMANFLEVPASNAVRTIVDKALSAYGNIPEIIFEDSDIFDNINNSEAIQAIADSVEVAVQDDIPNAIVGSEEYLAEAAKKTGEDTGETMANAMAVNFENTWLRRISGYINSGDLGVAESMINNAKGALARLQVDDETRSFINGLIADYEQRLSRKMVEAGKNAGGLYPQGVIFGIGNEYDQLVAAGALAGQAVDEGALGPDGINAHSPSKKGIAVGEYFVAGICQGILSLANQLTKTGAEVVNGAVDSAESIVARIDEVLAGDLDFEPVISPIIDISDIQSKTGEIKKMLNTDGVYKFAADTLEIQSKNEKAKRDERQAPVDEFGRRLDALVFTLDDLRDMINNQNDRDLNIEVNVDGAKLAEATLPDFINASRANGTPFYSKNKH